MNHWKICGALLLVVMAVVALGNHALGNDAPDAGALSDKGKTIDPLTISEDSGKIWQEVKTNIDVWARQVYYFDGERIIGPGGG